MKNNTICTNLEQDFTAAERATARKNIGATHIIQVVTSSGSMSEAAYSELTAAVDANEDVIIQSSSGGSVLYWQLKSYNSAGYDFYTYTAEGMKLLHIATNRAITVTNERIGYPTVTRYAASNPSWHKTTLLKDNHISSGNTMFTFDLGTPITLYAGKHYLLSSEGIYGNVFQEKKLAVNDNLSYQIVVTLEQTDTTDDSIILGKAEIANLYNTTYGPVTPVGGLYTASFSSNSILVSPAADTTYTKVLLRNSGNIEFGFNSSNPALMGIDYRMYGINVMEVDV